MTQPFVFSDFLSIAAHQNELPWQPFRPGVDIYRLYGDGQTGSAAALLRYEPGARIPLHAHPGFEHILVLAGAQQDEHGEYAKGTLMVNSPGSTHTVASPDGCLVLVIWERPVVLLEK